MNMTKNYGYYVCKNCGAQIPALRPEGNSSEYDIDGDELSGEIGTVLKFCSQKCVDEFKEKKKGVIKKKEGITIHGANNFTSTICGIDFNTTVPCRMTNVTKEVTCLDCLTILKIREKNKKKEE